MKVKCKDCGNDGLAPFRWPEEKCETCHGEAYLDFDVDTASLIVELEARRPCGKCKHGPNSIACPEICVWGISIVDNFTPLAKKERE